MSAISVRLRRMVVRRAADRCEYCRLSQTGQEAAFHVDHIEPQAAGGASSLENLALACVSCSLRQGARRVALDPLTNAEAPLFHPRRHDWPAHFRWDGVAVEPLTPTGHATVAALAMNRPLALAIRREETTRRRHPPP